MSSIEAIQHMDRLSAWLETGRIPHAMLFFGPGQMEAAHFAKHFAELLFCRASGTRPCGVCEPCRLSALKTHPDIRWLGPEESDVIKIEAVREFTREAMLKPYRELRRVFVIRRAETMNEHAQNALLKTLEEPPGPSHFILLAESPELLLATVRSRVQRLYFASASKPAAEDEAEGAARKEALDYLLGATDKAPEWTTWERQTVLRVLEAVLGDLRDVLVMTSGAPQLSSADHRPFKERAAGHLSPAALLEILEKVSQIKESIRMNTNLKLALPVLWTEAKPQTA